ncbi:MAG: DNA polymerase III subunit delta [Bacteroidetes bacterium]|nr:MAG: DNA polymerase III subunit delta [Bacteroidota bacterium]
MASYTQIMQDIRKGKFAPVYYLFGEEGFFIDKIAEALEAEGAVLQAGEADFNRALMYGPDTTAARIVSECRSFPVMAARRLVIVKEAHRLPKGEAEKLAGYIKQPAGSTVLALLFKDRKAGLPKAAADAADKIGVSFQSKKMYDSDVQKWADEYLRESGFEAEAGIGAALVSNLGPNLNLIENELEKIFINLRAEGKTKLALSFVYQMINVDKEFNVFELIHALSERQTARAHMITDRLTQNVKINPPVLILSGLFQFFHNVALVHRGQFKDPNSIKNALGVNYYQARDYAAAGQKYSPTQTFRNLTYIQEADLMLKGATPTLMDESHILKTLVWKMLN